MKLLLYTDVHWSETSSIIRGRGNKYSLRLENLIKSVNWAESIATEKGCDAVVCLGDFFDKPNLTAEEITALTDIRWCNLPHYFLVGNHDANINDLSFASTFVFNNKNFEIIYEPTLMPRSNTISCSDVLLLPYITEDNRQPLKEYLKVIDSDSFDNVVILSHNDIAGIVYGQFVSKVGFKVEDILNSCNLFINGHLHNSGYVDDKILNLGNLSGQNFSEDAFSHRHYCAVLDTDTLGMSFYENPYAFNFYKIMYTHDAVDNIGPNAVVSITCTKDDLDTVKLWVENNSNIVISRIQSIAASTGDPTVGISSLADTDHLLQFKNYVLSHVDNTDALIEELSNILR